MTLFTIESPQMMQEIVFYRNNYISDCRSNYYPDTQPFNHCEQ